MIPTRKMSLSNLIKSVNQAVRNLPRRDDSKTEERMELIAPCEKLKAALETPLEDVN